MKLVLIIFNCNVCGRIEFWEVWVCVWEFLRVWSKWEKLFLVGYSGGGRSFVLGDWIFV